MPALNTVVFSSDIEPGSKHLDAAKIRWFQPGVGKYIARSVCANAFGQPKAVFDTNVARILQRFLGIDGGKVKLREAKLSGS